MNNVVSVDFTSKTHRALPLTAVSDSLVREHGMDEDVMAQIVEVLREFPAATVNLLSSALDVPLPQVCHVLKQKVHFALKPKQIIGFDIRPLIRELVFSHCQQYFHSQTSSAN